MAPRSGSKEKVGLQSSPEVYRPAVLALPSKQVDKELFPYDHISFSACGWMYMYHFGILQYITEHFDVSQVQTYGTSAGALAACALCCDYPATKIGEEIVEAKKAGQENFLEMVPLVHEATERLCPHDAHLKCR